MKVNRIVSLFATLLLLLQIPTVSAYWVWSPTEGRFISAESAANVQRTADEQYQYILKLRQSGKEKEVIRELQRWVRQYPKSSYASEAQYLLASILEENGKYIRAAAEYKKLIREFARSARVDDGMEHLFKIGNLFLTGQKQELMGVKIIPVSSKAVDVFQFILDEAPYGPYGDQAQLRLGIAYRKMKNFEEAVKAFEALIANYPTSSFVDEAHYQLAETSYESSQNSIRDQQTLQQASDYLKQFIKSYGATSLAERARILKQQLDEQDAEKNYRIGLYYEKKGFIDSALIYYEDVALRYTQTAFGKKAAERFETLNKPAFVMQKGQAAIEQRIAEVRSLLQAIEKEEEHKAKTPSTKITEPNQLRNQLQVELVSLTTARKRFDEETGEKFHSRWQALRDREKNLREKFKIFERRKKSFKDNPSSELDEAFQKWHQSLLKEQDELARERKTVQALGLELKGARKSWTAWVPYWHRGEIASEERAVQFKEKKWDKLEQMRNKFIDERQAYEKQLVELTAQLEQLDREEFKLAKKMPFFIESLPSDFRIRKEQLAADGVEIDRSVKSFEASKNAYVNQFGPSFLKALALDSSPENVKFIDELIASKADLEETLKRLQNEKAVLAGSWVEGKEKLNTMVKALDEGQNTIAQEAPETTTLSVGASTQEEQDRAERFLKKRMKYLEREMRSRVDQIQDWERENAERIDHLEALLHPKDRSLRMGKVAGKAFAPAQGAYKLGRAFLFGLPHRERDLIEEANQRVGNVEEQGNPEQLKIIRDLKEEIELQSILIQGRANEISDLESRLKELKEQTKQFPDFTYQSLLVDRFPSSLKYSLTNARELLGERNQEAVFAERINRQTQELEHLEKSMKELDQKIELVGISLSSRSTPASGKLPPGLAISIPGSTETLPTSSEAISGENSESSGQDRAQLESKLVHMKAEIMNRQDRHRKELEQFEKILFEWYQTKIREKLIPNFPPEGKAILDQENLLRERKRTLEQTLKNSVSKERVVTEGQKEFLDRKLSQLEKRKSRVKPSAGSLSEAIDTEIKTVVEQRNFLVRDISTLEEILKK